MVYEVLVENTGITFPNTTGDFYSTTTPVFNTPIYIYFYQIFCPRCETVNWLQLEQLKACKKCGSTLKAVSHKADYEIEVEI